MSNGLVQILDGNTFVVSNANGDIEASLTDPTGLFSFDTRFLSQWVLTVNGQRLNPLSVDDLQYFETRFFLVPGTGTVYIDAKLSVIRRRAVGNGFHEELTILNHDEKPVDLVVRIDAGCDFADLFEVKDALAKKGKYYARVESGRLRLGYQRERFTRETLISASAPARLDKGGLTFKMRVEPHGGWSTDLDVVTATGAGGTYVQPKYARGARSGPAEHGAEPREMDRGGAAPRVRPGRAAGDVPAQPGRPRRAPLLAARSRRTKPPGGRSAVVHDHVRPGQHLHQPAGASLHAGARGDDPGSTRGLAGQPRRRLPGRGPGSHPPRDAVRGDDGVRGASAFPVLRLRRRDAALRGAARRVRALDRRPEAGPRARAPGPGCAQLDRRVRGPSRHRLHLVPTAQREDGPREPVLEGLVGLDLLPGRPAARVPTRDLRAPGIRVRREDPRSASRTRRLERPRPWQTSWRRTPPTSSAASTATSGSRTASTSLSLSTPRGSRSTRCRRTTGICSGAASSTSRRPKRLLSTSSARGSSPAGASGRWPKARGATTRSATTSARSGRSTTRSSPGACGGTASRTRPRRSPRASWTPPRSSTDACPRHSAATRETSRSIRSSTRPRAARRLGRRARRSCCCRTMLGLEPIGDHLVVDPALPQSIGHLELLDIPGRWGRIDAFGRGRIDVDTKPRSVAGRSGTGRQRSKRRVGK